MVATIVGTQIRERRRALGIAQVELARRIGISASYLNLIERNKRRIAGALLRRTAAALDLRPEDLDGAAERRLAERLTEIAHLPGLAALGIETRATGELIGRYPGWARALAALARSERAARDAARALADRLTHDPFLGETVHRMLSRVAAVRAAAEILSEHGDLPARERARFVTIIAEETRALTDIGEALASYFEGAAEADRTLTPLDEVEALFDAHANHFAAIEAAAARGQPQAIGAAIDAVLTDAREIETATASARARQALGLYAEAAVALPLDVFQAEAARLGYDVELLAARFRTGVDAICRRLTALPPGGPRFGYVRANASGAILEMRGLQDLAVPRYAAACPLWILYRAQQAPERTLAQHAQFPAGGAFVFVARARPVGAAGFGRPRHYVTDMLTMHEETARRTVYTPAPGAEPEPVGPACRLCPREDCAHWVANPLTG